MRIGMVGPVYPYRGGIAQYTATLAHRLGSAGHEVKVHSFHRQYPAWLYPGETDRDTSQAKIDVAASYVLDPLYPWTWIKTARQLQRERPNVVIIQWWTPFWAPAFAALGHWLRKAGIPVVFLIHNVVPHEARFWDAFLSRMALSTAHRYIVQTEKEGARLRALIPQADLVVTPLPVFTMFHNEAPGRMDARIRLALPHQARILLFFGIVRPYKGLKHLIEALSILKQKNSVYHLVIAGEFWEPESIYSQQIEALGLQDSVSVFNFYIPNEDVPVYFSAADAFVAPYVDGTQSAAVKTALAFGMPIVLTHCIIDETLAQCARVKAVDEADPAALARAVEEVFTGPLSQETVDPAKDWDRVVRIIEAIAASETALRKSRAR